MNNSLENKIEKEKSDWKKALLATGYGVSLFLSSFLTPIGTYGAMIDTDGKKINPQTVRIVEVKDEVKNTTKSDKKTCVHVVQSGENLTKILPKYGIKEDPETWAKNRGIIPEQLGVGQKIDTCAKPQKRKIVLTSRPRIVKFKKNESINNYANSLKSSLNNFTDILLKTESVAQAESYLDERKAFPNDKAESLEILYGKNASKSLVAKLNPTFSSLEKKINKEKVNREKARVAISEFNNKLIKDYMANVNLSGNLIYEKAKLKELHAKTKYLETLTGKTILIMDNAQAMEAKDLLDPHREAFNDEINARKEVSGFIRNSSNKKIINNLNEDPEAYLGLVRSAEIIAKGNGLESFTIHKKLEAMKNLGNQVLEARRDLEVRQAEAEKKIEAAKADLNRSINKAKEDIFGLDVKADYFAKQNALEDFEKAKTYLEKAKGYEKRGKIGSAYRNVKRGLKRVPSKKFNSFISDLSRLKSSLRGNEIIFKTELDEKRVNRKIIREGDRTVYGLNSLLEVETGYTNSSSRGDNMNNNKTSGINTAISSRIYLPGPGKNWFENPFIDLNLNGSFESGKIEGTGTIPEAKKKEYGFRIGVSFFDGRLQTGLGLLKRDTQTKLKINNGLTPEVEEGVMGIDWKGEYIHSGNQGLEARFNKLTGKSKSNFSGSRDVDTKYLGLNYWRIFTPKNLELLTKLGASYSSKEIKETTNFAPSNSYERSLEAELSARGLISLGPFEGDLFINYKKGFFNSGVVSGNTGTYGFGIKTRFGQSTYFQKEQTEKKIRKKEKKREKQKYKAPKEYKSSKLEESTDNGFEKNEVKEKKAFCERGYAKPLCGLGKGIAWPVKSFYSAWRKNRGTDY